MVKRYIVIIALFFLKSNISYSQLYIMRFSGPRSASDCNCVDYSWEVRSNGVSIGAIIVKDDYLIYNIRPTYFQYYAYRPDTYMCSGPCHDYFNESYANHALNADCSDYFIGNQVLVRPNLDSNSFCDAINLAAVGCTGTQRFFWEYSTDGSNFTKTNINTGFNENLQFIKANFPALNNYFGTIYFRVLIDSDPNITEENVYSNVVNYNITSCSPFLNGDPIATDVKCNNEPTGSVTLNFKTDITTSQKLLLNLYKDNNFMTHKFVSAAEIINKSFTWTGLAAGSYFIKYQAQTNTDASTRVGSQPVISPTFTIANVTPITFTITAIQPVCTGEKGRIHILASGGTAPYSYVLDNESLANRHSFTGNSYIIPDELSEGDHTVMVIDSNECTEK